MPLRARRIGLASCPACTICRQDSNGQRRVRVGAHLLRVGGAAPPAASRLLRSYLAAQLLPAASPRLNGRSVLAEKDARLRRSSRGEVHVRWLSLSVLPLR